MYKTVYNLFDKIIDFVIDPIAIMKNNKKIASMQKSKIFGIQDAVEIKRTIRNWRGKIPINKLEWFCINYSNQLTENDWASISCNQKLSEEFIEKYRNKVDWHYISECQNLSEQFIEKYKDLIKWNAIINAIIKNKYVQYRK